MDEPCPALDRTSTGRVEETIHELAGEVTVVIVTHDVQQAAGVSDRCAFFLAEQGTPGGIVELGTTDDVFPSPGDCRTADHAAGRSGSSRTGPGPPRPARSPASPGTIAGWTPTGTP